MKRAYWLLVVLLLCIACWKVGRAQSTAQPFTIVSVSATHTSCPAVTTGQTMYCFAFDGAWQSLNGAAYVQLGASGVTSVNGKTGAVVLGATTTSTTTSTTSLQ